MQTRLLWVALLLTGCASSNALPERSATQTLQITGVAGSLTLNPSSSASTVTLAFPIEQVWRALPTVFDSLGLPVSTVDQAKHVIGVERLKIRQRLGKTSLSRYFDCGETQIGPNADSYDVFLTLLLQLQPSATNTTSLSTVIDATAKPVAFSQNPSACSTKGAIEQRMTALIQAQLQR